MKINSSVLTIIHRLILWLMVLVVGIPLLWGLSLAFRSNEEIAGMTGLNFHSFVPRNPTMMNFQNFFSQTRFFRVLGITLFVCVSVTFLSVLFNTMGGFAFARLRFPGKEILFSIILATMILPLEILIIPLYGQVRSMGLVNRLAGLIVPFLANGFGIFLMRQFIMGIPLELEEAAIIDGCGRWRLFLRIILPLSRTSMITLVTIQFLAQWDSFIVPVTFISDMDKRVLQVVLADLHSGVYFNDYGILYAGIAVSSIPIITFFIAIQKQYIEGIASTGIKG